MRNILFTITIFAVLCAAMLAAGCCCCTGCDVSSLVPSLMPTPTPTPTPTPEPTATATPTATIMPSPTPTPGPQADPNDPILGTWSDSRSMSIMVFNKDFSYRWQASSLYLGTWEKIAENTYKVTYTDTDASKRIRTILYNPNAKTMYFEDTPFGMFTKSV